MSPKDPKDQSDDDVMMDQVALECMKAIESKDKAAFMEALHVLVADLLMKMQSADSDESQEEM